MTTDISLPQFYYRIMTERNFTKRFCVSILRVLIILLDEINYVIHRSLFLLYDKKMMGDTDTKNSTGPAGRQSPDTFEVHFDARRLSRLNVIIGLLVVGILVYLVFSYALGVSRVSGDSMSPALQDGQVVLFSRLPATPKAGDIVAITTPAGDHYIKRVIAGPGDVVSIEGSSITVNGKTPDTEAAFAHGSTEPQSAEISFPLRVGEDMYFVLGDNREASVDSRTFGPISSAQIDGIILGR